MRQLKTAFALRQGAGKGSLFMAKKFALNQVLGNGRAVHLDERRVRAGTLAVKRPGHEFLARAALALDEDGRLSARHFADELAKLLNGFALAEQFKS